MKVKVNDGAEANILPLDSFRSMFPHALNEEGYPKDGFLKGSRMNLECYDDSRLINHGSITAKTSALLEKVISRSFILCCRNKNT